MSESPSAPASSPSASTPTPRRSFWQGTYDSIAEPMRRWFRSDDEGQQGFRLKGNTRREKYTQMRLLFVDVGNASRSQMAQALALVAGFHAESAGTFPSMKLTPEAVQVMQEEGMDISEFRPKPLNTNRLGAFDRVIVFGDALPKHLTSGIPVDHWNVDDPQGYPVDGFRQVRRDLARRIKVMAKENGVKAPETVLLTA